MAKRGCTGTAKTSVNRIETDKRHVRAVELKMEGKTLSEIAEELGYAGPSGVSEAIKAVLKRNQIEVSDSYRQVMEARLDKMLERVWPDALDGDLDAMGMVLKIEDRRARLMGADRKDSPIDVPDFPKIETADDAVKAISMLIDRATSGQISLTDAISLATLINKHWETLSGAELLERLKRLEAEHADELERGAEKS